MKVCVYSFLPVCLRCLHRELSKIRDHDAFVSHQAEHAHWQLAEALKQTRTDSKLVQRSLHRLDAFKSWDMNLVLLMTDGQRFLCCELCSLQCGPGLPSAVWASESSPGSSADPHDRRQRLLEPVYPLPRPEGVWGVFDLTWSYFHFRERKMTVIPTLWSALCGAPRLTKEEVN